MQSCFMYFIISLQLTKLDTLPPLEEMTHEMYCDYFPDQARNPEKRPTFWPHDKNSQPENDPKSLS